MRSITSDPVLDGYGILAVPLSDNSNVLILAPLVAKSITVPTGATIAVFSSTSTFWANTATTASVPDSDVTDGSASELNPEVREVTAGDTISVIAPVDSIVNITFYRR